MKIPDFPRIEITSKELESLYNWCYALYLELKEEEKHGKEAAVS